MSQTIKERALARRKQVQSEPVPMPEWGEGTVVYVREMTGQERDAFESAHQERKKVSGLVNFRAHLVVATAHDEAGERLFAPDEVGAVGELPAGDVRRIFDVAARINGLGDAAEKSLEKKS